MDYDVYFWIIVDIAAMLFGLFGLIICFFKVPKSEFSLKKRLIISFEFILFIIVTILTTFFWFYGIGVHGPGDEILNALMFLMIYGYPVISFTLVRFSWNHYVRNKA